MIYMFTRTNIDEITALIQVYIPNAQSIYLFGSYSRETANDSSDIDIAIVMDSQPEWRDRKKILNNLYRETGRRGFNVDFLLKTKDSFTRDKELPTISRVIGREGQLLWMKN